MEITPKIKNFILTTLKDCGALRNHLSEDDIKTIKMVVRSRNGVKTLRYTADIDVLCAKGFLKKNKSIYKKQLGKNNENYYKAVDCSLTKGFVDFCVAYLNN